MLKTYQSWLAKLDYFHSILLHECSSRNLWKGVALIKSDLNAWNKMQIDTFRSGGNNYKHLKRVLQVVKEVTQINSNQSKFSGRSIICPFKLGNSQIITFQINQIKDGIWFDLAIIKSFHKQWYRYNADLVWFGEPN